MMTKAVLLVFFAILAVDGTASIPRDFASQRTERMRWVQFRNEARADAEKRPAAVARLVAESLRHAVELQSLEADGLPDGEALVAPFTLLPVLLEMALELGENDPTAASVVRHVRAAERELKRAWRGAAPAGDADTGDFRRFAKSVQSALPRVAAHLRLARDAAGPAAPYPGPPTWRREAAAYLLADAEVQAAEFADIGAGGSDEDLQERMRLLAVTLQMAEESAAGSGDAWRAAYHVAVARRELDAAPRKPAPDRSADPADQRRWAQEVQKVLPRVVEHVRRAREALKR